MDMTIVIKVLFRKNKHLHHSNGLGDHPNFFNFDIPKKVKPHFS